MIHLDTNYILRFLVKDNKEQLIAASSILEDEDIEVYIPPIVIAEANYF